MNNIEYKKSIIGWTVRVTNGSTIVSWWCFTRKQAEKSAKRSIKDNE